MRFENEKEKEKKTTYDRRHFIVCSQKTKRAGDPFA